MKTKAEVADLLSQMLVRFPNEDYSEIEVAFYSTLHRLQKELEFLRESGQKEYAGADENALGNFERLALMLDINRESILWVYATKHLDGITSYLRGHKSQREDVRGRINDVIVYLILFRAMIDDKEGK
jgi:hypothetical protein